MIRSAAITRIRQRVRALGSLAWQQRQLDSASTPSASGISQEAVISVRGEPQIALPPRDAVDTGGAHCRAWASRRISSISRATVQGLGDGTDWLQGPSQMGQLMFMHCMGLADSEYSAELQYTGTDLKFKTKGLEGPVTSSGATCFLRPVLTGI